MKLLFITRKYPPSVGGMENYSYELFKHLKIINEDTYLIANKYNNKVLTFFIPYSFFKALYLIWTKRITHVHLGDGLLAFEGKLIKKITKVKTSITVHGLDITFDNSFYQSFFQLFF